MKEHKIDHFVTVTSEYFKVKSPNSVVIETPYLVSSVKHVSLDYTTQITISGRYRGSVYLTANTDFVKNMIMINGGDILTEERIVDAIGEVANIISGNVREYLGSDFNISPPHFIEDPNAINASNIPCKQSYVVPFYYQQSAARLIINVLSEREIFLGIADS